MKKIILFLLLSLFFCSIIKAQHGTIVITEVFYDTPYNESNRISEDIFDTYGFRANVKQHHNGEFIEFYNPTDWAVDISGWSIKTVSFYGTVGRYTFPQGTTINPQGMLIVAYRHVNTPEFKLEILFPEIQQTPYKQILYHNHFFLTNKEGRVLLYDNMGKEIDGISYKGSGWNRSYWNLSATNKRARHPNGKEWLSIQRQKISQHSDGYMLHRETDFMANNATPLQLPDGVTFPDISYWAEKPQSNNAEKINPISAKTINGALNISPTGAAVYTIPIEVPLGVTGMQPNIAITYNSQSGNGVVGWGTSISGISAITRIPKSIYYDDAAKGITYDSSDAFMLDGQRLIKRDANSMVYNTESDPFTTITYMDDYFEVLTKDGMKYTYGNTDDSKQNYSHWKKEYPSNAWFLNRVEDAWGNYMTYTYSNNDNYIYPETISYRKNANIESTVSFTYEERPDTTHFKILRFVNGEMNQRLKRIDIKTGDATYRQYIFSYESSNNFMRDDDNFSRLTSVTEKNGAGEASNPVYLNWEHLPTSLTTKTPAVALPDKYTKIVEVPAEPWNRWYSELIDFDFNKIEQFITADLDGDGKDDLIGIFTVPGQSTRYASISLSSVSPMGDVSFGSNNRFNQTISIMNNNQGVLTADLNGNGIDKLITVYWDDKDKKLQFFVCKMPYQADYLSSLQPDPGQPPLNFFMPDLYATYSPNITSSIPLYAVGDFNNDGKANILIVETKGSAGNYRCRILNTNTTFNITGIHPRRMFISDFNGDGMTDFMLVGDNEYTIFWNQGNGTFSDAHKTFGTTIFSASNMLRTGDFNGDGLTDFLMNKNGSENWYFALNNGDGTFSKTLARNMTTHNSTSGGDKFTCIVYDFDLDGKSDVVFTKAKYKGKKYDKTETYWLRSTGTKLEKVRSATSDRDYFALPKYFVLGDFDGDGRQELMNFDHNCLNSKSSTGQWHIYQPASLTANSGRLTRIRDAFNSTTIDYANLSISNYNLTGHKSYPLKTIRPALSAVKSVTSTNGVADPITVNYNYINAQIHLPGKGFLGFDKQTAQNVTTGITTETGVKSRHATYFTPLETYTKTTIGSQAAETTTEYGYKDKENKIYFAFPQKITERDFDGNTNTTNYKYDNNGNITWEKTAFGNNVNYREIEYANYVAAGSTIPNKPRLVTVTQKHSNDVRPFINKTRFEYNNKGSLTQKVENYDTSWALTTNYLSYDNVGNLTSYEVSGSGISTIKHNIKYDNTLRFAAETTTSPATTKMTYTYDMWGNLLTENDETNGADILTISHVYDRWGRKTATTFPDGRIRSYERGFDGTRSDKAFFIVTKGTGQQPSKIYYDAVGRETSIEATGVNGLEISVTNTYNAKGQLMQTKNKRGNLTLTDRFEYDAFGRVVEETKSSGQIINYKYDNHKVTTTTNGRTYIKTFDTWGNVKTATDPGGTVEYMYCSNGKPQRIDAEDAVTTMKYDGAGNQIELIDPNAGKITYKYNALGQLKEQTDARGKVTKNEYDNLNRLDYSLIDGIRTKYHYGTAHGNNYLRLTEIKNENASIRYDYNRYGDVITETRLLGNDEISKIGYGRDAQTGQMYVSSLNGLQQQFSFDEYGNYIEKAIRFGTSDSPIHIWELTGNTGTQTTAKLLDGTINITKTYDRHGYLTSQRTFRGNNRIHGMSYGFEPLTGNLWERAGMMDEPEYFHYDNIDRLTSVNYDSKIEDVLSMQYQLNGNIQSKTGIGQYDYDNDKLHAVIGIDNTAGLVSTATQNITYNAFNKADTITEIVNGHEYKLEITYGPDQQRWKTTLKKDGELEKTTIFAPNYERVTDAENTTKHFYYIYGGDGLAAIGISENEQPEKLYIAHTDHLGSIVKLTDENDNAVFAAAYDAWGNQTVTTDSIGFHRGYTRHEHLPDFKLINMNGRMYDPLLGRMLSPDNFVANSLYSQDYNRYAYARNNPLIYTDPTGEFITWSIGKRGFSIGFNLTPIGIPLGGGINIGWSGGGSAGVYGEVGYRVGGTGLGAGATISQSLDYGFGSNSWSTTTSAGVYGSLGLFNAGGNVAYNHTYDSWSWGVSAGINLFGNDAWGIGLNVGYGSGGWDFGLGGYYNPWAWKDNPVYAPDEWNDDPNILTTNNCYSYALDDINNGNYWGLQPGDVGGYPITSYSDINLDYILKGSISDGRIKQPNLWNKLGFGKNGYYEVYLVIDQGKDYHWYRQDKGGNWSHKPGITPVKNVDASGRIITNPVKANHNYGSVNYNNGARRLWVKR